MQCLSAREIAQDPAHKQLGTMFLFPSHEGYPDLRPRYEISQKVHTNTYWQIVHYVIDIRLVDKSRQKFVIETSCVKIAI